MPRSISTDTVRRVAINLRVLFSAWHDQRVTRRRIGSIVSVYSLQHPPTVIEATVNGMTGTEVEKDGRKAGHLVITVTGLVAGEERSISSVEAVRGLTDSRDHGARPR